MGVKLLRKLETCGKQERCHWGPTEAKCSLALADSPSWVLQPSGGKARP